MANIIDDAKILNDEQLDSVAGGRIGGGPIVDAPLGVTQSPRVLFRCTACGKEWVFLASEDPKNRKCDCGKAESSMLFVGPYEELKDKPLIVI